jgi:hypothetical protein
MSRRRIARKIRQISPGQPFEFIFERFAIRREKPRLSGHFGRELGRAILPQAGKQH